MSEEFAKTVTAVAGVLFIAVSVVMLYFGGVWWLTLPEPLAWNFYYLNNPSYSYLWDLAAERAAQKILLLSVGAVFIAFAICSIIISVLCFLWYRNLASHRKGLVRAGIIGCVVGLGVGALVLVAYFLLKREGT